MKSIIFFFLSLTFITLSCSNSSNTDDGYINSDAQIIGYDLRMCACCGGWLTDIEHDTLRIWEMPKDFEKLLNEKQLPVPVKLNWKKKTDSCGAAMNDIILVNSISLR